METFTTKLAYKFRIFALTWKYSTQQKKQRYILLGVGIIFTIVCLLFLSLYDNKKQENTKLVAEAVTQTQTQKKILMENIALKERLQKIEEQLNLAKHSNPKVSSFNYKVIQEANAVNLEILTDREKLLSANAPTKEIQVLMKKYGLSDISLAGAVS